MADYRSRADKMRAVLDPKSGATEGERDNARRLLKKMGQKAEAPPTTGTAPQFPFRDHPPSGDPFSWRNPNWSRYSQQFSSQYSTASESARKQAEDVLKNMSTAEILDLLKKMGQNTPRPDPRPQYSSPYSSTTYHNITDDARWRHDQFQIHDWVRHGTAINGKPLHRCAICLIYDQKRHQKDDPEDHDWVSFDEPNAHYDNPPWVSTEICSGCNLKRLKPIPFRWNHHSTDGGI